MKNLSAFLISPKKRPIVPRMGLLGEWVNDEPFCYWWCLVYQNPATGFGFAVWQAEQSYYLKRNCAAWPLWQGLGESRTGQAVCGWPADSVATGNQNHYQANANNPIFNELKAITQKTFGVVDIIKAALAPLLPQLNCAFIYGSVAQGTEHAGSDIDLMLVVMIWL